MLLLLLVFLLETNLALGKPAYLSEQFETFSADK